MIIDVCTAHPLVQPSLFCCERRVQCCIFLPFLPFDHSSSDVSTAFTFRRGTNEMLGTTFTDKVGRSTVVIFRITIKDTRILTSKYSFKSLNQMPKFKVEVSATQPLCIEEDQLPV